MGLDGFDNAARRYVSLWVDTMGTGFTLLTGDYDARTRTLTVRATIEDPATKQKKTMRCVTRFVSDTVHVWESFETGPGGEEHKTMEITYTRR